MTEESSGRGTDGERKRLRDVGMKQGGREKTQGEKLERWREGGESEATRWRQRLSDSEAAAGGQSSRWERGERMTVLWGNKRNGDTCREDKWGGKTLTGNNRRGKKSATSGKTSQTGEDWESAADLSQKQQQQKKKKTGEKTAGGKHRARYFQEAGDEQRKDGWGTLQPPTQKLHSCLLLMHHLVLRSGTKLKIVTESDDSG